MGIQDLTTSERFKAWYDFKGSSADDNLIADLIEASSTDILAYLDRKTILKSSITEYYDGTGGSRIMLRQWPALAVSALNVNGSAITAAAPPNTGYFLDPYDGYPPGRPQFISITGGNLTTNGFVVDYGCAGFPRGARNVNVTYSFGYAVLNEPGTIAASKYQIMAAQDFGFWTRDEGVTNATTGAALVKVASSPATGQYSVVEGVYQFAAADVGVAVLLNYSFIPATLDRACRELVGERYAYRARIGQKSQSFQGNTTASYDTKGLTDFVMQMLAPYKRMVPY